MSNKNKNHTRTKRKVEDVAKHENINLEVL